MRIPTSADIPRPKLTHYLLVPRPKSDKSKFLAQAGFTALNPDALETAIRAMASRYDAYVDHIDEFGKYYRVDGVLEGPNGSLPTSLIWIEWKDGGSFHFVTLKPWRT